MSKKKIWSSIFIVGLFLAGLYAGQGTPLMAQDSSTKPSAVAPNYTEQQWRGEGLFLQRCSICHLVKKLKNIGSPPTIGPDLSILTGVFANATPDEEKVLRTYILKGSPPNMLANMPGFQYGLDTKDIDDLIAYLKAKK